MPLRLPSPPLTHSSRNMTDCVSLETARELKEAGWPQLGCYYYAVYESKKGGKVPEIVFDGPALTDFEFAAPTIGELLEALPWCGLVKEGGKGYQATQGNFSISDWSDNPADALALLWLELKKKNL